MIRTLLILFISLFSIQSNAQKVWELTLEETITRAQKFSPDAQTARHSFRSEYWNYKYYQANYLPSVTLASDPYLNRSINKISLQDGKMKFVEQNMLGTDLSLSITQNIPWTGGSLSLQTEVQRMDMLGDKTVSWQTSPVNIVYRQSIFGYNGLKWSRRIEPVRYLEAKKSYMETLELVASRAVDRFFDLANAQSNYEIACFNYANADTLYKYAEGRYKIGTITENEMLQLELNKLSEETNRMNARNEVDNSMQNFRSFLGIQEDIELKVVINDSVPDFIIGLSEALLMANENSPDIQNMIRRKLESENAVAQAKANAGLKADIYIKFGLTQTADKLREAYKNPIEQQHISLGISLPILDWGRGKGRIRVARSQRDLIYTQVEQNKTDFELNIRKLVKQFNLQAQRVKIAVRTDETAQRRNDVARRLYLLGKSTILDLNASIVEKDNARKGYVSALYKYWSLYYTLRSITLYDFEFQRELMVNIKELEQ
ncbi:TolC family protein [Bacteroides sp. 224]|uniref:TolC family protein n=1 Tax=Bacteroides sp. 224 TaxID=2302936 RepID=UPI0013D4937B|nr:TolC family protein [Bacteroides sp. 224]NDV64470.1 TolC family protein [Bacteroides sp. 224]